MFTSLESLLGFCLTVAVVIIVILWLFCLRQKFVINGIRDELQALRAAQTAASKKIDNAKLSLQTFEKDLKILRENLAK